MFCVIYLVGVVGPGRVDLIFNLFAIIQLVLSIGKSALFIIWELLKLRLAERNVINNFHFSKIPLC